MNATSTQIAAAKPQFFNFDALAVRVVGTWDAPWFVATDVLAALGLGATRVSDALATLDEDEKGYGNIVTLGGEQQVRIVSESGLYALIFRSRKPSARLFRRWVTGEVLPTLRKTGMVGLTRPQFVQPVRVLPPAPCIEVAIGELLCVAMGRNSHRHALVRPRDLAVAAQFIGGFDITNPDDHHQVSRLLRSIVLRFAGRWLPTRDTQAWWVAFQVRGKNRSRRYFITAREQDSMPTETVPVAA